MAVLFSAGSKVFFEYLNPQLVPAVSCDTVILPIYQPSSGAVILTSGPSQGSVVVVVEGIVVLVVEVVDDVEDVLDVVVLVVLVVVVVDIHLSSL